MQRQVNELSDSELIILKCFCDIFNSSHEGFPMQLALNGIDQLVKCSDVRHLVIEVHNEQTKRSWAYPASGDGK